MSKGHLLGAHIGFAIVIVCCVARETVATRKLDLARECLAEARRLRLAQRFWRCLVE